MSQSLGAVPESVRNYLEKVPNNIANYGMEVWMKNKIYNKARYRATNLLIQNHAEEFQKLLAESKEVYRRAFKVALEEFKEGGKVMS